MKAFTWVVRVISFIVMLGVGLYLAWGFLSPAFLTNSTNWLIEPPGSYVAVLAGLGLPVLGVAWLILRVAAATRSEHIQFETERGKVLVTLSALQESLSRILVSDDDVRDARVFIVNAAKPSRPLRVHAQVVIYDRNDVISCQKHLQGLLEERFKEMMVIDREVRYDVELVRIRPRSQRKGKDEPADESALFQGPQYPIGD